MSLDEQSAEMERRRAALRRKRNASFCYEVHGRSRARSRKAKEMEGMLTGFTLNVDQTQNITVTVTGDFREQYDKLKDHPVSVEIRKATKKRSKDANAMCWAMCADIGNALRPPLPKEEVYRKAIRDVGEYEPLPIKAEAVETFQRRWAAKGTGWFAEVIDDSKLPGYKLVFAYYGSSTYDTAEMSRLIDYLVDDAKQMGIPIPASKEQEEALNAWSIR